jgi:hypothetical protein
MFIVAHNDPVWITLGVGIGIGLGLIAVIWRSRAFLRK